METVQAVQPEEANFRFNEERKQKFNELWLRVIQMTERGKEA